MKRALLLVALACVMWVAVGCAMSLPYNGVLAPIMNEKTAVAVGDSGAGMGKVGTAQVEGIILYAWGDGSISAACKSGGITKIHHVDSEDLSVLGIYARKIITVHGE